MTNSNKDWFTKQVGTMTGVGFLTVMRTVELRRIRTDGVKLVLVSGKHVDCHELERFPELEMVRAMLFHVPWRKQHQAKDVWVPLVCPRAMARVLEQFGEGRRQGGPDFLFPSRLKSGSGGMNLVNPISRQSFQNGLQRGLMKACGFSAAVAKLFTGHALRVGGSNYMRRLGLSDEVHRKLGGWASIESSQGYMMVLSPREQATLCGKMALVDKRKSAFNEAEIDGLVHSMATVVL